MGNLLISMNWDRMECAGLGQGFFRCSRHTAFRGYIALGWVGNHVFLIMEEGTQAILAVPWGHLSRGDGLEKPGPLLIEEEWTVLD